MMDPVSPEAKALFERAREGFAPSEEQIDRIRRAVLERSLAGATSSSAGSGRLGARSAWRGKLLVVPMLAAGLVVGGAVASRFVSRPLSPAETGTASPSAAPLPAPTLEDPVPAVPERADEAISSPPTESAGTTAARPPATAARRTPAAGDTLDEEVRRMAEARQALRDRDATRALSLLDEYVAKFPKGVLREEQLASRVLALCALGNQGAAQKVRGQLERLAPTSPQLARLSHSCAGDAAGKVP